MLLWWDRKLCRVSCKAERVGRAGFVTKGGYLQYMEQIKSVYHLLKAHQCLRCDRPCRHSAPDMIWQYYHTCSCYASPRCSGSYPASSTAATSRPDRSGQVLRQITLPLRMLPHFDKMVDMHRQCWRLLHCFRQRLLPAQGCWLPIALHRADVLRQGAPASLTGWSAHLRCVWS